MIIRQPPKPGALDRYAVNLGRIGRRTSIARKSSAITQQMLPAAGGAPGEMVALTEAAAAVKEYFDVSVYRNILDMLNTFEGVLNRFGQDLTNELWSTNRCPQYPPRPVGHSLDSDGLVTIPRKIIVTWPGQVGYAASKLGPPPLNKDEAAVWANRVIKTAGLKTMPNERATKLCTTGEAYQVAFFEVPDLLNLARTINFEMNRVRLPVPHNFRQIANAIQGRDYRLLRKHWSAILPPKPADYGKYPYAAAQWIQSADKIMTRNYINAVELLQVYTDLKKAVNAMRTGTRNEIDAASLPRKVEESTKRKEQEE